MKFSSFLDRKQQKARKELKIVGELLERGGFQVECFIKSEEPYIYVKSDTDGLPFEGVRVYKVGDQIAYRIQRENKTEPYGSAYSLDLEEIFGELITDMSEEKAAKKIGEAVVEEFKNFFKKSVEAQDRLNSSEFGAMGNNVLIGGGHGDLSNTM